jgi:hypothetical protein
MFRAFVTLEGIIATLIILMTLGVLVAADRESERNHQLRLKAMECKPAPASTTDFHPPVQPRSVYRSM